MLLAPVCTVLPLPWRWIARALLSLVPHPHFIKNLMCWTAPDLARTRPKVAEQLGQDAVQRLNDIAPQIETEILPNGGHDLTILQTKRVNTRIVQFLVGA